MSDDIVKTLLESLTDEQKAQLVQGLLVSKKPDEQEEVKEETVSSNPRSNITENFQVVKNSELLEKRKTPVRARKNQWVDGGEDRDPEFDPAKFEKMGKAARQRGKVKKRTIECHVCGRSFAANPAYVHGEFTRCNRCTGR